MRKCFFRNLASLTLFASLVVFLQFPNYLLLGLWIVAAAFYYFVFGTSSKQILSTVLLFGVGFYAYLYISTHWIVHIEPKEVHVFLNRLTLLVILLPFFFSAIFSKTPQIPYLNKPQWKKRIYFPFIWSGFHSIPVGTFLLIALSIAIAAFLPILILNGWSFMAEVWLLALIFSIMNGVLEELIWRGSLLSRFSTNLGEKWGVVITSVGFGLQHYHLGIPWFLCIAFILGGLFYGGITVKSNSVVPSMIWHFGLNVLMVLGGLILR
ncbi:type II CAAX endopeptidase family protein [Sporosarcina sp. 179-K 3D1 HS]|uniref:CPBP family intramembrane glutamic endopeptidase n=1 Tax=Sporosarcina sp. 179-K 3D1 HS TaxID=3232169 RepID=UPI0039A3968F